MSNNSLGSRMKSYEEAAASKLLPHTPTIVRVDGRAFHTLTAMMNKPFDESFRWGMRWVARNLVQETGALFAYTQSDEISLLFYSDKPNSQIFFNGNRDKLVSITASLATAYFNSHFQYAGKPVFDSRAFNVPTKFEAYNYFLWREQDAVRNSLQMVARSLYSHKELNGKKAADLHEMLYQKGVNWNDYSVANKRGTYYGPGTIHRMYSPEEARFLPEKHPARLDPSVKYTRNIIEEKLPDTLSIAQLENPLEIMFGA